MEHVYHNPSRRAAADDLHRILSTSISIFDSAITLLGEPSDCGVQMPGSAHIACIKNILTCLGIGDEDEGKDLLFS
jgi:hypothetical protein